LRFRVEAYRVRTTALGLGFGVWGLGVIALDFGSGWGFITPVRNVDAYFHEDPKGLSTLSWRKAGLLKSSR